MTKDPSIEGWTRRRRTRSVSRVDRSVRVLGGAAAPMGRRAVTLFQASSRASIGWPRPTTLSPCSVTEIARILTTTPESGAVTISGGPIEPFEEVDRPDRLARVDRVARVDQRFPQPRLRRHHVVGRVARVEDDRVGEAERGSGLDLAHEHADVPQDVGEAPLCDPMDGGRDVSAAAEFGRDDDLALVLGFHVRGGRSRRCRCTGSGSRCSTPAWLRASLAAGPGRRRRACARRGRTRSSSRRCACRSRRRRSGAGTVSRSRRAARSRGRSASPGTSG